MFSDIIGFVTGHWSLLSGGAGLAGAVVSHLTPVGWVKYALMAAAAAAIALTIYVQHVKLVAADEVNAADEIAMHGYAADIASLNTKINDFTTDLKTAGDTITGLTVDKDKAMSMAATAAAQAIDYQNQLAATSAKEIGDIDHVASKSDDVPSPAIGAFFNRLRAGNSPNAGSGNQGSPVTAAR